MAILKVRNPNGSWSDIPAIKGEPGASVTIKNVSESTADGGNNVVTFSDNKTVTIKNGSKGTKGDKGDTGANGKDGTSVTHSWNGTTLTVTSASGTSSADLKGDKGDTGPAGKDAPQESVLYLPQTLTDAQKAQVRENIGVPEVTAAEDSAVLGAEMAIASGWTLGAGWSGNFANGFTHASGNTEPLTFTPAEIKAGGLYQVTFKSSVRMTTTNLFVQVGNSTQFNLYGEDAHGRDTLSLGLLAVDTNGLVFTPESTFAGTLTEISLREITGSYEAVQQYFDADGAVSYEIHVTPRGLENVFIGQATGELNTTGHENSAIGVNALSRNTSGFWNSALGKDALKNNTAGSRNIAVGFNALRDNEVGQRNVAIGAFTMTQMKAGNWNIAIGADSMNEASNTNQNVAVGFNTLTINRGDNNTAIGANVLSKNTTGANNVSIGTDTMVNNTTGVNNVAIGNNALRKSSTGIYNTAVGSTALYNVTTGQKNVGIGFSAGKSLTTGKRCIAIGDGADLAANVNDQLNIGNLIKGSLDTSNPYMNLIGGLRLPNIPLAYSNIDTEVWNNGGVLMVGNGGMNTIVQAVISALPVYNGEVE